MSTGQEVLVVQPEQLSEKVGYLTGEGRGLEFGYSSVSELAQCQKIIYLKSYNPISLHWCFFTI